MANSKFNIRGIDIFFKILGAQAKIWGSWATWPLLVFIPAIVPKRKDIYLFLYGSYVCFSLKAIYTLQVVSRCSKILNTRGLPKMLRETVQTQIRLKQSDQCLSCLLF